MWNAIPDLWIAEVASSEVVTIYAIRALSLDDAQRQLATLTQQIARVEQLELEVELHQACMVDTVTELAEWLR